MSVGHLENVDLSGPLDDTKYLKLILCNSVEVFGDFKSRIIYEVSF